MTFIFPIIFLMISVDLYLNGIRNTNANFVSNPNNEVGGTYIVLLFVFPSALSIFYSSETGMLKFNGTFCNSFVFHGIMHLLFYILI